LTGKFRAVWEKLYRKCNGIIFVLDSSDPLRIAVAKEELLLTLSHEDLEHKPVPILFLANNMDNNEAIDCTFCTEALELSNIRDRRWQMYSVNALTGEGLIDAVDWFTSQVNIHRVSKTCQQIFGSVYVEYEPCALRNKHLTKLRIKCKVHLKCPSTLEN